MVLVLMRDSRDRVDAPQATARSAQPDKGFQLRNLMPLHLLGQFAGIFFLAFTLCGLNVKYRHLDLSALASYSSLPYIAGVVGMVIGAFPCDRVLAERRTEFIVAGLLVAGLCIAGVWIAESAVIAEIFLICGLFFTYMIRGPIFSLPLDTVPTSGAGTYMGQRWLLRAGVSRHDRRDGPLRSDPPARSPSGPQKGRRTAGPEAVARTQRQRLTTLHPTNS